MATSRPRGRVTKKGTFTCEKCGLSTPFHAFGRNCPFSSCLVFLEEAYIARDPFSPDPRPLLIGSHCSACNKTICVAQTCSIFFTKRFCTDCVRDNLKEFPAEIQQEVLKSSKQSQS